MTRDSSPTDSAPAVEQQVASLKFEKVPAGTLSWSRSLLLLIGGTAFVAIGAAAQHYATRWPTSPVSTAANEVPPVEGDPAPTNDLVLQAAGHIELHSQVQVNCRVKGIIVRLHFDEGQAVKENELLAELEDIPYRADVAEARALLALKQAQLSELKNGSRPEEVRQAEATLQKAVHRESQLQKQLVRLRKLGQDNIGASAQEVESAEANHLESEAQVAELRETLRLVELGARRELIDAAQAEVERAEALLQKAEYFLDSTRIVAPVDGIVLEKSAELGQRIGLELGPSRVCVIARRADLEAVVDIHERDLALIKLGQPCVIRADARPEEAIHGSLRWLSPMLDRQRSIRQSKVRIDDPPNWLLPDMNCHIDFLKEGKNGDAAGDEAKEPDQTDSAFVSSWLGNRV